MGWLDKLRTQGLSTGKKLHIFTPDCSDYLGINYKELTAEGKLESSIFCACLVLVFYKANNPENYKDYSRELFVTLYKQQAPLFSQHSGKEYLPFFNSRINFYEDQVERIFEGGSKLPSKLYSTFYINPLILEPKLSKDLGEIMLFKTALYEFISEIKKSIESL